MYNIHTQFKNNIKKFLRNELTNNDLRRFYFHYKECETCKEILLEEFILYTTFNDIDKTFKYDYQKELDIKMDEIGKNILSHDKYLSSRYIIVSIAINLIIILLAIIIIRVVY